MAQIRLRMHLRASRTVWLLPPPFYMDMTNPLGHGLL